MIERTPEFDLADKLICQTNKSLFLTGKAGTGKTTFLKYLKENCNKRLVIVAPTGVAAINASGMTIHSFFQINFGPFIPNQSKAVEIQKFRKEKINIIRTLDLLIIDEISMVRADLLDAIDEVLRKIRRNHLPFGGVQLLMIGDTQQLTPVVKDDEWTLLSTIYQTPYFFSSTALKQISYAYIELKTIFRQEDEHFINLLNKIRENQFDQSTIDELNKRYIPNFHPSIEDGYIQLTTHNWSAQRINEQEMNKLPGMVKTFKANVKGNFPEANYPTDESLCLKIGAQVMFIKNDSSPEKKYYNGKIGVIKEFTSDSIIVTDRQTNTDIHVSPEIWENIKYRINPSSNEIEETIDGTFEQYPLKTAWAITIHKSQGLTFEKAIIDAQSSFSHGQVYVALSRCKTLEGMILSTPLTLNSIKHDLRVEDFNDAVKQLIPSETQLNELKAEYQLQLLTDLFSFQNIISDLTSFHRLLIEHLNKNYPNLIDQLDKGKTDIEHNITAIAERFQTQLKRIIHENPDAINERVQKGVDYFIEKCYSIIFPLYESCGTVSTDNKSIEKRLNELYAQLTMDINIKASTLIASKNGFDSIAYFKAKNDTLLSNNTQKEPQSKKDKTDSSDIQHPELFERLRIWRKGKAEEQKKPAYMILSQTALINLSNYLPTNDKELININGIGPKTAELYGKDIVEIIEECIIQYDYKKSDIPIEPKKRNSTSDSTQKIKTKDVSLRLWKEGKSIEEIANAQNLATSTIQGHLVDHVVQGTLSLEALTTQKRLDVIKEFMKEHPNANKKEIFEGLNSQYSYPELKLAEWQAKGEEQ
ncbi:MAG: AAA family ATPase [Paludibacteraceae bacterium]|nr:AAA family ATPase [Paludibacteraceae bacterium]